MQNACTLLCFFSGIILSNLSEVSLSSTRNLAIIGISLLFGVMVPRYIEMYPDDIKTGKSTHVYFYIHINHIHKI